MSHVEIDFSESWECIRSVQRAFGDTEFLLLLQTLYTDFLKFLPNVAFSTTMKKKYFLSYAGVSDLLRYSLELWFIKVKAK